MKYRLRSWITILLFTPVAIVPSCRTPGKSTRVQPEVVSLIRLLATPQMFNGKRIVVRGFYHGEFESYALYLSSEDAKYRITENSVWVWKSVPKGAKGSRIENVNDQHVLVQGTFSCTPDGGGHMGGWSGELSNITLFVAIPVAGVTR